MILVDNHISLSLSLVIPIFSMHTNIGSLSVKEEFTAQQRKRRNQSSKKKKRKRRSLNQLRLKLRKHPPLPKAKRLLEVQRSPSRLK